MSQHESKMNSSTTDGDSARKNFANILAEVAEKRNLAIKSGCFESSLQAPRVPSPRVFPNEHYLGVIGHLVECGDNSTCCLRPRLNPPSIYSTDKVINRSGRTLYSPGGNWANCNHLRPATYGFRSSGSIAIRCSGLTGTAAERCRKDYFDKLRKRGRRHSADSNDQNRRRHARHSRRRYSSGRSKRNRRDRRRRRKGDSSGSFDSEGYPNKKSRSSRYRRTSSDDSDSRRSRNKKSGRRKESVSYSRREDHSHGSRRPKGPKSDNDRMKNGRSHRNSNLSEDGDMSPHHKKRNNDGTMEPVGENTGRGGKHKQRLSDEMEDIENELHERNKINMRRSQGRRGTDAHAIMFPLLRSSELVAKHSKVKDSKAQKRIVADHKTIEKSKKEPQKDSIRVSLADGHEIIDDSHDLDKGGQNFQSGGNKVKKESNGHPHSLKKDRTKSIDDGVHRNEEKVSEKTKTNLTKSSHRRVKGGVAKKDGDLSEDESHSEREVKNRKARKESIESGDESGPPRAKETISRKRLSDTLEKSSKDKSRMKKLGDKAREPSERQKREDRRFSTERDFLNEGVTREKARNKREDERRYSEDENKADKKEYRNKKLDRNLREGNRDGGKERSKNDRRDQDLYDQENSKETRQREKSKGDRKLRNANRDEKKQHPMDSKRDQGQDIERKRNVKEQLGDQRLEDEDEAAENYLDQNRKARDRKRRNKKNLPDDSKRGRKDRRRSADSESKLDETDDKYQRRKSRSKVRDADDDEHRTSRKKKKHRNEEKLSDGEGDDDTRVLEKKRQRGKVKNQDEIVSDDSRKSKPGIKKDRHKGDGEHGQDLIAESDKNPDNKDKLDVSPWELAARLIKKPPSFFRPVIPPPPTILAYVRKRFPNEIWPEEYPSALRYYPDGMPFVASFPNGSSEVFYPHGGLAMAISAPNPTQQILVFKDPSEGFYFFDKSLQAGFNSLGIGVVYDRNGETRVRYDEFGGFQEVGKLDPYRWIWKNGGLRILQKINKYMSLRIFGRDSIHLQFHGNHRGLRFNLGEGRNIANLIATVHKPPPNIDIASRLKGYKCGVGILVPRANSEQSIGIPYINPTTNPRCRTICVPCDPSPCQYHHCLHCHCPIQSFNKFIS